MSMENMPQIKRESIEVKTWGEFKKALDGWMFCDADYCPDCYEKLVAKYKKSTGNDLKSLALSIVDARDDRAVADGWLVECEDCGKSIFRPAPKKTDGTI